MKLSVVIPVYNVERFVRRCVDSVLVQPWGDMEIIVVNDGSKDRSLEILQTNYGDNPRVTILDKPNGGLSDARNFGLQRATGEIITFVDSDDWLDPETYLFEPMFERDAELDVVVFPYRMVDLEDNVLFVPPLGEAGRVDDYMERLVVTKNYSFCNKLFRRELFDGLVFPKGKNVEDMSMMADLVPRLRGVRVEARGMYEYVQNPGSITKTVSPKMVDDLCDAADKMLRVVEVRNRDIFLAEVLVTGVRFLVLSTAKVPARMRRYLREMRGIPDVGRRKRMVLRMLRAWGVRGAVLMLRLFRKQAYRAMYS